MATVDPRLERYLSSLESALKAFPVSDRAEIITEIKSHVLEALERDPSANLETVLAALGEPETVANRYLLERGLQTAKPPISPVVKWLVIGFLGTLAMLLIFTGYIMSRFTPLVKVDEKEQHVSLLGGLIEVNGDEVDIKIDDGIKNMTAKGSFAITNSQPIAVRFNNGAFAVETSNDTNFSWNCRARELKELATSQVDGKTLLDLTQYSGAKCDLQIPQGSAFAIDGTNGKIKLSDVRFPTRAHLTHGKIEFEPSEGIQYRYDIKSSLPTHEDFVSSQDPSAIEIVLEVANGKVEKD